VGKKSLIVGAAIGYVLGARAGRKRYDQIVAQVSKLWNDPKVKSKVDQAQTAAVDTAKSAASSAKDAVSNNPTVQSAVQTAKDKLPGSGSDASSTGGAATNGGTQPGSTTPATPRTGGGTGTTTLPTTPASASNTGGRP
jgi:hypothetical protein